MHALRRATAALLAALVLAGGLARLGAARARAAAPPDDEDGRTYQRAALNLARRGAFSFDDPDEDAPLEPGTRRAPLWPVVLSLTARDGAGEGPAAFFWRAHGAAGLALAALAALLAVAAAGPLPGLAAGALLAFDPLALQHAGTLNIQLFFGALVALAGLALLRWGRAPTPAGAALAGLAVGATLLTRSTLAPFLLFLPLWLAAARPRLKRPGLQLALFAGAALLAVLPWLARNRLLLGRLQPFEAGVVEYGVVAGASGTVSDDFPPRAGRTAVPDVTLDDAGRERRGPLAALREASALAGRDPLVWLAAVLARAGFWGWGLLLWVAAVPALRRARREDLGLWTLGGLAVYWNVHLLTLSSARHFIPAFAPLAAVAAAAFVPPRAAAPAWAARPAAGALALPPLLVLLAWGALARELAATPWAGRAERSLDAVADAFREGDVARARAGLAALEPRPLAGWQEARAARLRQSLGDFAACEERFAALARRHPRGGRFAADAAVCAALSGAPERALAHARAALAAEPGRLAAALTLGALLERRGRAAEAVRAYEAALSASRAPAEDPLRRAVQAARLAALGRPRGRT